MTTSGNGSFSLKEFLGNNQSPVVDSEMDFNMNELEVLQSTTTSPAFQEFLSPKEYEANKENICDVKLDCSLYGINSENRGKEQNISHLTNFIKKCTSAKSQNVLDVELPQLSSYGYDEVDKDPLKLYSLEKLDDNIRELCQSSTNEVSHVFDTIEYIEKPSNLPNVIDDIPVECSADLQNLNSAFDDGNLNTGLEMYSPDYNDNGTSKLCVEATPLLDAMVAIPEENDNLTSTSELISSKSSSLVVGSQKGQDINKKIDSSKVDHDEFQGMPNSTAVTVLQKKDISLTKNEPSADEDDYLDLEVHDSSLADLICTDSSADEDTLQKSLHNLSIAETSDDLSVNNHTSLTSGPNMKPDLGNKTISTIENDNAKSLMSPSVKSSSISLTSTPRSSNNIIHERNRPLILSQPPYLAFKSPSCRVPNDLTTQKKYPGLYPTKLSLPLVDTPCKSSAISTASTPRSNNIIHEKNRPLILSQPPNLAFKSPSCKVPNDLTTQKRYPGLYPTKVSLPVVADGSSNLSRSISENKLEKFPKITHVKDKPLPNSPVKSRHLPELSQKFDSPDIILLDSQSEFTIHVDDHNNNPITELGAVLKSSPILQSSPVASEKPAVEKRRIKLNHDEQLSKKMRNVLDDVNLSPITSRKNTRTTLRNKATSLTPTSPDKDKSAACDINGNVPSVVICEDYIPIHKSQVSESSSQVIDATPKEKDLSTRKRSPKCLKSAVKSFKNANHEPLGPKTGVLTSFNLGADEGPMVSNSPAVECAAPQRKAYMEPFISSDPLENQDNEDPRWDILRRITTDEERVRKIRDLWGNVTTPDPNCNMTSHARQVFMEAYAAKGSSAGVSNGTKKLIVLQELLDRQLQRVNKRVRDRMADDDVIMPPSKRQRIAAAADLNFNECRVQECERIVYQNFDEICNGNSRYISLDKKRKISYEFEKKINHIMQSQKEVERLHLFYSGSYKGTDCTEVQRELTEQDELYAAFRRHYKWQGNEFISVHM